MSSRSETMQGLWRENYFLVDDLDDSLVPQIWNSNFVVACDLLIWKLQVVTGNGLKLSKLGTKINLSSFFFTVLEFELKAYTLSHSTSLFFCEGFFLELGSHQLFAQAGFEPWSS
jgi:hypothetical protein